GTVRLEGSQIAFGCSSPNLAGVLENRNEVLLGDTSVGQGGAGGVIHNWGAFVKDRGTGTAYIDPTFFAHPGGYEQAQSGTFYFRDYRNLR
uniref:hypothetical protein n=1 Tax=Thermus tenuipuniceus TaxID=2078690 RepID=UPI0013E2A02A